MGLDMFFEIIPKGADPKISRFREEIAYFRKHFELHDWLKTKWCEQNQNTDAGDFNCEYLQITLEIVEGMEKLCNKYKMSDIAYGILKSTEENWILTQQLCQKLKNEYLYDDQVDIYYIAWW